MPRIGGHLDVVQVNDPGTPVAGRQHLYFKSDGVLYTKKSDGSVVVIGSGGGGATATNVVTSANTTANKLTVTPVASAPIGPASGDLWLVTDVAVTSPVPPSVVTVSSTSPSTPGPSDVWVDTSGAT